MRINPIAENILIVVMAIVVGGIVGWTVWFVRELYIIFRGIGLF
jgi:hypothetical protein